MKMLEEKKKVNFLLLPKLMSFKSKNVVEEVRVKVHKAMIRKTFIKQDQSLEAASNIIIATRQVI